MKYFIKHILIFFLIFFVIEKAAWFLLDAAPKREYDTRLEQLLNGEINKDLMVIGSSRGAGNILTEQLENETGLSSYNLSYQGTDIKHQKFILEVALKYNRAPKFVVLSIDNPDEFKKSESVFFRTGALLPLSKYNHVNKKLVEKEINTVLSHIFLIARLNSSHFVFEKKKPSEINPLETHGSMPLLKKKKRKLSYEEDAGYDIRLEDNSKLSAFQDIQKICIENNITLIYAVSPNFKSFNKEFYKRFKSLTKQQGNIFVYDTLNPIYKDEAYFFDSAHLMEKGAQIFTSELSGFINKK